MERNMLARLIKDGNKRWLLCMDGTILPVNNMLLNSLFTSFDKPELFCNGKDRWNIFTEYMEHIDGETLAYISINKHLVIIDASAFNEILSGFNPDIYVTAEEYAKEHNRSVSRIKMLCKENRIPGVQRRGGQWFIPKYAKYPKDQRKYKPRKTNAIKELQ